MHPQTIWTQRIETDCIVFMATYRLGALTEEKIAEIAKADNFYLSFIPEGSTCNSPCEVQEGDIFDDHMTQIRQYFLKITADPSFHPLLPIVQYNPQFTISTT